MPWIQTFSGKKIYPLNPRIEDIDIADIAHALSMTCRFNGHCKEFYSVAQHSVLVSKHCYLPFDGLMHDAAEAYLSDVPAPIKPMLNGFAEIEDKLLKLIFVKFGLEYPYSDNIKTIDRRLCISEGMALMPDISEWKVLNHYSPLDIEITPVGPSEAKGMFMERFEYLGGFHREKTRLEDG